MTAIQTSMRDIYARLKAVGLDAKFVRNCVLPEWWDDKLVKEPGMRTSVELILARHLGIPPSVLSDPNRPLELPERPNIRYRVTRVSGHQELKALVRLATRAAELAVRSLQECAVDLPGSPEAIREEILARGVPWVGLRELIDWCWSHGIPVLRLSKRPDGTGRLDGIALRTGGRPVIVVANLRKDPEWLSFVVAHELGHILLGHVDGQDSVLVDEELASADTENEEAAANGIASRLLDPAGIGQQLDAEVLKVPASAARRAKVDGKSARVDPSYILIQAARRTGNYGAVNVALRLLGRGGTAAGIFHDAAVRRLRTDTLCADDQDFLFTMTGIEPMIAD